MNYLTLAAIIRNEEYYVQEWFTFHYLQGFERFVIVLHKCNDKTEERIKALPFADKIRIHRVVSDTQHAQMTAYAWIIENYGKTTEWLAIVDSDEFMFGMDTNDFKELLANYEEFGGLFVNWMEYGHNNRIRRPRKLCIEAYTKRAPADSWWHTSGKSIIKPKELLRPYAPRSLNDKLEHSILSPHLFKTAKPTVHTDFTPVSYRHLWRSEYIRHEIARCNHYRYKSREDWLIKCQRGNCNDLVSTGDQVEWWKNGGDWSIVDTSAGRFAQQIKELLK